MIPGVNIHRRSTGSYATVPLVDQLALANDIGIRSVRIDVYDASTETKTFLSALIAAASPLGISVVPVLVEPPASEATAPFRCYRWCYDTARKLAQAFPQMTWEAGNELNFRCIKPGVDGSLPEHYDDAKYQIVKAAIIGMYAGFKSASDAPVGIGTAGIQFGFLDRLQEDYVNGVRWDITTWHIYVPPGAPKAEIEAGAGQYLTKLASYGKPIAVTEYNQQDGHLSTQSAQTLVDMAAVLAGFAASHNVIAAYAYELLDEPGLPGGEATYGLCSTSGVRNSLGNALKTHLE